MIKNLRNFFTWQRTKIFGAYALFWSWNLIFLTFMTLGFAPIILPELLTAVLAGVVPWKFVLCSLGIILIPVVAVILGATILRNHPMRLLALGYGVEGPLMLLLILRFFGLQELNPAMMVLYTIAFLGLAAFLWLILKMDSERFVISSQLRVIGVTMMLGLGIYACLMMAFYAIPLSIELVQSIPEFVSGIVSEIRFGWRDISLPDFTFYAFSSLVFVLFGGLLWAYTATLLVAMPIVVPILYWQGWRRTLRELRDSWSAAMTALLVVVTIGVCAFAIAMTVRQPQHRAFALLETPPTSAEQAQDLLDSENFIRRGLTNAYLSSFRHVSAVGEVEHIRELYTWALDFDETRAKSAQSLYEWMARPMLYMPVEAGEAETAQAQQSRTRSGDFRNPMMAQESERAAELYESFFDEPINRGERESVVAAARSTWQVDRAEKAWQAVDDREVHLVQQEITVEEHGDWADLELYEVYQNQTAQQQEVVYYFSLPESAVVTGVWLGNSADRDKRFVYTVAPRGAAQAVYRNEVVQRRDPALLEQIGPRQYRLRIFPIPERSMTWSESRRRGTIEEGQQLHMWLTWRVLAQMNETEERGWALPALAERRNIFWDADSVRLLGDEPFETDDETWMPSWIVASGPTDPVAHRIDYGNGKTVIAKPLAAAEPPSLSDQNRLALVVDRSYSMRKQADAVAIELAVLAAAQSNVDLYLTASQFRGEAATRLPLSDLDSADLLYVGGQNAAELLIQFDELRGNDTYDAVLVLTDGTGYELGEGDVTVPLPNEPIWMIHLGGFPLGYDDETLEAIQASGGGIAATVDEAFARMATTDEAADEQTRDLIDGYVWETLPTQSVQLADADLLANADLVVHGADDGFAALGGRRLILAEMQRARNELDNVEILDELHAIAIENSIVTPYSSMLVLVNEQQRQLLEKLENQADRFDREHEDVGNTVPQAAITGVPEPEEWLLILIAVALLGWYAYSNGLDLRKAHA